MNKHRIRYYWRRFLKLLGFCPDCLTTLNKNWLGLSHCPRCGKTK